MKYKILENVLSNENFENIISTFFPENLTDLNNFSWNFQKGIVRDPDLGPTGYEEYDWIYVHPLYSTDNGMRFDKHYSVVKPILNQLKIKKLFDIRANLLVPTQKHIRHEFHTDRKIDHKVALFYVTTCNGFTELKDICISNCLENNMLLFDGKIEHCSVTSTDNLRCVININYV